MPFFLFFFIVAVICVALAQGMSAVRGCRTRGRMMAAALFGPLALIPLAAIRRR